ncbi:LapA family protein [Limnobacter parvus]|uniref:LapA family protein n=1 Tax=Limnobacter parvus TaxID=2939690 RepID=A0ABT1XKA6_9BURK|nr:LapA family protein [Limnobacter parvus]MCR2747728.1 LapA family protein [Limnobacter parvus]
MKILAWVVRIALFLVVLTFSLRNTDLVTVKWLPGLEVQTQLVVALLVSLLIGAVFAWISLLPSWLKAKRIASVASKNVERLERELSQMKSQGAGVVVVEEPVPALPIGPSHGI